VARTIPPEQVSAPNLELHRQHIQHECRGAGLPQPWVRHHSARHAEHDSL